ncbi:hypothetical protein OAH18_01205 [bacterium]|nr:hypothetical protein [bacterium]
MSAPQQLRAGGVYASKTEDGYQISKIVVLNDFAAFVLSYRDTFNDVPESVNTTTLQSFYFAPIDPAGFAEGLVFIQSEPVTVREMETYNDHIEMQSQG